MLLLVAGQGALPAHVAGAAPGAVLVAGMEGALPDAVTPDLTFRLERLGSFLKEVVDRGAREVCFAGAVRRPSVDPAAIDAATMPLVPRMMAALGAGDDGALRTVMAIFEEAGLRVRAAHEVAPDLLPPAGVLTGVAPGDGAEADAERARAIVAAMGAADVGQACAVLKGQALALESVYGTDWMLDSLAQRPDGRGGLLYKGPKPGQDRRADLPAIGPGTVGRAARAGLDGIVIEAGGVMVLDRDATVAAADEAGLFLWVREP